MKSLQYVLIRLYLRFLLFGDFTDAKSTVSAGVQHGVPGWGLGDLKQAPHQPCQQIRAAAIADLGDVILPYLIISDHRSRACVDCELFLDPTEFFHPSPLVTVTET